MLQIRPNEPGYALLRDREVAVHNCYGQPIDTITSNDARYGKSLNINNDPMVGQHPHRYKQHGFYFNADNCIACHACEAACSEKNDNPAHLAFRSVGFVEGGTYPDYRRINISMACNHCDNPVCLKGCPTRAYTKFAEYGAVLQDPDICFGCGYCTWVCPYNAPQLDPVKGQVSKCNLCIDRLEAGLKPACVAACLGKALDFGVIESIPEGCHQAKTRIPGFPNPDITHPNIRFQQVRTLQRDMLRVDDTALKYHRDEISGAFLPQMAPKPGFLREWNLKKLFGSHENSHIVFTLAVQTAMGAFLLLTLGLWLNSAPLLAFGGSAARLPALSAMCLLMAVGLFKLNRHLGKPHRFYRGFYNLKLSPVSREIAGVSLFFAGLCGDTLFELLKGWHGSGLVGQLAVLLQPLSAALGVLGAGFGGYYMYKLYRIPARPFWNHWHTGAAFVGAAVSLGALLLGLSSLLFATLPATFGSLLAIIVAMGLLLEGTALVCHARDLQRQGDEGAVSFYWQTTRYAYPYWLRNSLLVFSLWLALGIGITDHYPALAFGWLALATLASSIIGRALFYVLVVPTTMPGAFFWKNRGFMEHAREIGLANRPQLGIAYEHPHPFRMDELIATFRASLWPIKGARD